jgi:hypothetical protein
VPYAFAFPCEFFSYFAVKQSAGTAEFARHDSKIRKKDESVCEFFYDIQQLEIPND